MSDFQSWVQSYEVKSLDLVWRRLKTWATHTVKDRKHALTIQNIQQSTVEEAVLQQIRRK